MPHGHAIALPPRMNILPRFIPKVKPQRVSESDFTFGGREHFPFAARYINKNAKEGEAMRRMLWIILVMLLLIPAARAEETWTTLNSWGETVTWTRTETEWGSITWAVSESGEDWLPGFRYRGIDFAPADEFIAAYDEATGVETFYAEDIWCHDPDDRDSFVALAEKLLTSGEVGFRHDRRNSRLIIPGVGEAAMPEGAEIYDAYIRQQRLFMLLDTAGGGHGLRIVTWRDGIDVLDIAMPWSGGFDTFHVGPTADDHFILYLDTENPDFGYIVANEAEDGRWLLNTINTGWGVLEVTDWGVRDDMEEYWAYGACPWRDLAAMDWTTLPLTCWDALEAMEHEGWRFAAEGTKLFSAMDEASAVLMDVTVDTPLCLLKVEGDWAFVGVQKEWEGEADWYYGPWVGYVPVAMMNELPVNVLPGGEMGGWFVTMTVEEEQDSSCGCHTYTRTRMTFAPLDGWYDSASIEVEEGFAEAALAAYRETGYAATPMGFAESLLPYLWDSAGEEVVRDAVLTEGGLVLCLYDEFYDRWELILVRMEDGYWTNFRMSGPFRFTRDFAEGHSYGIEFCGE